MKFRFWSSYVSRNGKQYGAGIAEGHAVHTRGWHAGVKVIPRIMHVTPKHDKDAFDIFYTSGSSGQGNDVKIGRVHDTDDGPRFEPAPGFTPAALEGKV